MQFLLLAHALLLGPLAVREERTATVRGTLSDRLLTQGTEIAEAR